MPWEREQIGLLKALGYTGVAVGWHYMKLVLIIAAMGIAIGAVAGTWLGQGLTRNLRGFFSISRFSFSSAAGDIYVIAGGISIATAVAGGIRGIYAALTLPPAVAMSPPVPTHYARLALESLRVFRHFSQLTIMAVRHIVRWPVRSGLTVLGIAMSGSLLITALFSIDSIDYMVGRSSFSAPDRQDATVNFTDVRPSNVLQSD